MYSYDLESLKQTELIMAVDYRELYTIDYIDYI